MVEYKNKICSICERTIQDEDDYFGIDDYILCGKCYNKFESITKHFLRSELSNKPKRDVITSETTITSEENPIKKKDTRKRK